MVCPILQYRRQTVNGWTTLQALVPGFHLAVRHGLPLQTQPQDRGSIPGHPPPIGGTIRLRGNLLLGLFLSGEIKNAGKTRLDLLQPQAGRALHRWQRTV